MFRAMFSSILGSNLTVYRALVKCTDLLPTGDMVEMELHFHLKLYLQYFTAFEDGTDRGFRNVGKLQSDAGEIPKRTNTL
jgi:hypothetical protein